MINQLNRSQAIVNDDGTMVRRFSDWQQNVTRLQILSGDGSPEGNTEAPQRVMYMDESVTGTTGNILYIKKDADIGGDKSQGWVLV